MSATLRLLTITLCMNIMLTLGLLAGVPGTSLGSYDVLNKFITIGNESVSPSSNYGGSVPTSAQSGSLGVTSGLSFIDGLAMAVNFILLVVVSIFLPIYWAFALALPIWFGMLLFVEQILSVAAWILVIRGIPT